VVSRFNAAPIAFERTVSVRGYDDVTPRMGVAYDVFGTGKTAVKVNLGKYLDAATNDSAYTENNPANRIRTTMTRSWDDTNGNFVVDCDILNLEEQTAIDTCGAATGQSRNFANTLTGLTQVNPDILGGSGVRQSDWQVGVAVQQEVLPRVSVEVAYNRRWWQNFTVENNQLRGPADYEEFTFFAPDDPRLPGGGGYPITVGLLSAEAAARGAQDFVTFETDFGEARTDYWHGVDFTLTARMRNGVTVQGGTSTGRGVEDRCDTLSNRGAGTIRDLRDCRTVDPFRTTYRGLASYTIPKVDVLVSSTFRSLPAPELSANFLVPNTLIRDLLGRLPPGGSSRGNQNINLLRDGELYADERITQVDMRFAKILRFAGMRADVGVDLYNLFNANTAVNYDSGYDANPAEGLGPGGEWMRPTTIVQPRFVRLNLTVDF
jgi:hypothetical protein